MQKIIARAWSDEAFKKQLVANPAAVLREEGVHVPAGVQLHVVENTASAQYLVLPPTPSSREFGEQQLSAVKVAYPSDNSGISFLSGHCGWAQIWETRGEE